ncbi:YslB family protein [Bacillus sp. REN10]|uniref:YslB family protein n=1 Tax=Bacillus sp. REN10 TaxID=2782541 RepID=UPI001EEE39FA|nr:YslB family protein [Bacillus sp. REN10]
MTNQTDNQETATLSVPVFGYEIIRDVLLTDVLGKETADILYWAGKSIARKFPCATFEELASFFSEAGWGQLTLLKEARNEKIFVLSGPYIDRRFSIHTEPSFTIESGFLAEQISLQEQTIAESICEVQKRAHKVQITVKWE